MLIEFLIDIILGLVFSCEHLMDRSQGYSILDLYILLLIDSVAYILLYFYLSHVFPGRCGTPKPFYFIFLVNLHLFAPFHLGRMLTENYCKIAAILLSQGNQ